MKEIVERLQFLDAVGVGYLTLERAAATLSGGEAQRIRLATQIGSSLVGVLYILDEPSIGLHQRDNHKLLDMLKRLRDLGNTVIVVEHDEGTMRAADHIVDLGPGAGEHGGRLVAQGSPAQVKRVSQSLTGQYLAGKRKIPVPAERRRPQGSIRDRGGRAAQPEGDRRRVPAGRVRMRDRRLGLGQVHARQRDPVPRGRQPAAPREAASRQAPQGEGHGQDRQDHQHRPVADRPHAALQSRPPTPACSTTSASCTRAPRRRAPAATSAAGSRST